MPSFLAWLDRSAEDNKRMIELVRLFEQKESRDELGIGAVRDAFSERLFPGVSVVQTRARYLLFIPWIYRSAETRRVAPELMAEWSETRERYLIEALYRGSDRRGLIGRRAGVGVKTLASTIYWSGLQTYGIARQAGTRDQGLHAPLTNGTPDETDELAERRVSSWHPTLPDPPARFFDFGEQTFALQHDEATWLIERLADGVPNSMHAYLSTHGMRPGPLATEPWLLPELTTLPRDLQNVLHHARLFSLAINGASLLYNLLLARRFAQVISDDDGVRAATYEQRLAAWWTEVASDTSVPGWDRDDFWLTVLATNPRVPPATVRWIDSWLNSVIDGTAARAKTDLELESLVVDRERLLKASKSRFVNESLLADWTGDAGTGRLVYRWATAATQLNDLLDGLEG